MKTPSFEKEITSHLLKMSTEKQKQVLAFVRNLAEERPAGVPGKELLRFAGAIALDDLIEMEKAIDEGCEKVHMNDW